MIVGVWCWEPEYYGSCRMDITVVPSSDTDSVSEGLCGNSNGDPLDDFLPRNAQTVDNSIEPVLLAGSYM